MSLKDAYNGNEEIDTLFNKGELKQLSFDPASCQNIAILQLYLCIDGFKHKNSAVLCPILLNFWLEMPFGIIKHHAKCIDQNVLENTVTL